MTPAADLERYFGDLAASLGLHAGAWAAELPSGVVDALAISRKHDTAIANAQNFGRLKVIIRDVQAFKVARPAEWEVAALVYAPYRWPEHVLLGMHRCGDHARDGSHTAACGRQGSLAGLVGLSARVVGETRHERLMAVERKAAAIVASTKKRLAKPSQHEQAEREAGRALGEMFAPFRREAEAKLQGALDCYAAVRRDMRRGVERREIAELRGVFG